MFVSSLFVFGAVAAAAVARDLSTILHLCTLRTKIPTKMIIMSAEPVQAFVNISFDCSIYSSGPGF